MCDANGNMPPQGTTIEARTTNGSVTLLGGTIVPRGNVGCYVQSFVVQGDGTSSTGILTITAKTPKGWYSSGTATVND